MIILRMAMMAVVIAVMVQLFYFYLSITMNHTELIFIIGTSVHSSLIICFFDKARQTSVRGCASVVF